MELHVGYPSICKCKESPNYNQKVEAGDGCSYFEEYPAQDYYTKGRDAAIKEDWTEATTNLEQAIQLGLPPRDEVLCLAILADLYLSLGVETIKGEQNFENEEAWEQNDTIAKGINHFEKALTLDARNMKRFRVEYTTPIMGYDSLRHVLFGRMGTAYAFRSYAIKRKRGIDAAISYLQEKLRLFDYLPETWMSDIYFELGSLYCFEKKQNALAAIYFKKATEADAAYPEKMKEDDEMYQEIQTTAQHNLRLLAEDPEVATELRKEEKTVKKKIDRFRQSITDKLNGAGITAYSLFIEGKTEIEDKEVQEVLSQIKSIDGEIDGLTHQIEELKAQQPKGGFLSRLKDKASSTAKTAKIQLELRGQRKKMEQVMPVLGERLYSSYKKGVPTPSVLQQTWKTVDELTEEIKHKEAEYSSLEETLDALEV
jgi:hypothetical protein